MERLAAATPVLKKVARKLLSVKTPATTITTAPATASAGRSQVMVGPSHLRSTTPASPLCPAGSLCCPDAARATAPLAATDADRSRRPELTAKAARLDRASLKYGSHRTRISHPRAVSSLRSSDHCRLSQGSAIRLWIFDRPSPAGSIGSSVECNTRLRISS